MAEDFKISEYLNQSIVGDLPIIDANTINLLGADKQKQFFDELAKAVDAKEVNAQNFTKAIEMIKGKGNAELAGLTSFFNELDQTKKEQAFGITTAQAESLKTSAPATIPAPAASTSAAPSEPVRTSAVPFAQATPSAAIDVTIQAKSELREAVLNFDLAKVKQLAATPEGKAEMSTIDPTIGGTPLFFAAGRAFHPDVKTEDMVNAILATEEGRATAGTPDNFGNTPLLESVRENNAGSTKAILATEAGAKTVNTPNRDGHSPLMRAEYYKAFNHKNGDVIAALKEKGAVITQANVDAAKEFVEYEAKNSKEVNKAWELEKLNIWVKSLEAQKVAAPAVAAPEATQAPSQPANEAAPANTGPNPEVVELTFDGQAPKSLLALKEGNNAASLNSVDARKLMTVQSIDATASALTAADIKSVAENKEKFRSLTEIIARPDQLDQAAINAVLANKHALSLVHEGKSFSYMPSRNQWLSSENNTAIGASQLPEAFKPVQQLIDASPNKPAVKAEAVNEQTAAPTNEKTILDGKERVSIAELEAKITKGKEDLFRSASQADLNKDGILSHQELAKLAKVQELPPFMRANLPVSQLSNMINQMHAVGLEKAKEADTNRDGYLDKNEAEVFKKKLEHMSADPAAYAASNNRFEQQQQAFQRVDQIMASADGKGFFNKADGVITPNEMAKLSRADRQFLNHMGVDMNRTYVDSQAGNNIMHDRVAQNPQNQRGNEGPVTLQLSAQQERQVGHILRQHFDGAGALRFANGEINSKDLQVGIRKGYGHEIEALRSAGIKVDDILAGKVVYDLSPPNAGNAAYAANRPEKNGKS